MPPGLAAPRLVKTTFAVVLTWVTPALEIAIAPDASVPGPVHTAPLHPPVRSRIDVVEATSTQTAVFREIAM